MSVGDTLGAVAEALGSAGARFMVVGSFASTLHGEPRTTMDLDLVVDASANELNRFLDALPDSRWYVDADVARKAHRVRSMFNVIDRTTGWKVDIICLRDSAFARSEFARRVATKLFGVPVCVATAEDTVLAKLSWAQDSGSERQLRDVAGIVAMAGAQLDLGYIEKWAAELDVSGAWRRVRDGDSDS